MRTLLIVGGLVIAAAAVGYVALRQTAPADDPATAEDHAAPAGPEGTKPLRFLMVGLGQDMSRVSDGIWLEDYEMVRDGAQAIASHPRVTPEEMQAIRGALGDRFQEFVQFDQSVHGTAVQMAAAAEAHDMDRVRELKMVVETGCVQCHAGFRAEVRRAIGMPE